MHATDSGHLIKFLSFFCSSNSYFLFSIVSRYIRIAICIVIHLAFESSIFLLFLFTAFECTRTLDFLVEYCNLTIYNLITLF